VPELGVWLPVRVEAQDNARFGIAGDVVAPDHDGVAVLAEAERLHPHAARQPNGAIGAEGRHRRAVDGT
jgi:hypothetical protein